MLTAVFRWRWKWAAAVLAAVTVLCLFAAGREEASFDPPADTIRWDGETEAQRQSFLAAWGWRIEGEPRELLTVQIPETFDSLYNEYNELQRSQGRDLAPLAGQLCRRYRYRLRNHPRGEAWATLLVQEGVIVGGDVTVEGEDGCFPFSFPQQEGGNRRENVLS